MFTTYVRPHLDYFFQAVGPYMKQDFQALERVQRRATKPVKQLRHLSYEDRLSHLGICKTEDKAVRGDMIETFKILTGKLNVDPAHFFELSTGVTRGHHLKFQKKRCTLKARAWTFSNRVVSERNKLPAEVVSASSTNAFKAKLDQHWATTGRIPSPLPSSTLTKTY